MRVATMDDLPVLVHLSNSMREESPRFKKYGFSSVKMENLFGSLILSNNGVVFVIEREGGIIAGIAGIVTQNWFSDDLIAMEYGLFVKPEYRGSSCALKLIRAYISWAQLKGAISIGLGISTGIHQEKTADLYRSMGLKECSIGFEV